VEKVKKIVFLIEAHFNQRDYRRFGIELFQKSGFAIEVWDFSRIVVSGAYGDVAPPDPIVWDGLTVFDDRKEALRSLSSLDGSCAVISNIRYTAITRFLYRVLSQKDIFYFVMARALPISTGTRKLIAKRLREFNVRRLVAGAISRIPYRFFGVKPASAVLAPGAKYSTAGYPADKSSEEVWVHSFDYDVYLEKREEASQPDLKTAVFLDEFTPFHPDNVYMGIESAVTPEEYYPLLCDFFTALEKRYGIRIIIAAHPRSDYDMRADYFQGRKVIRGKTMELVRDSGLVIVHQSCAISYAVLFKKPIVFYTTDKLMEGFEKEIIEEPPAPWLASLFNKEAHNLNKPLCIDLPKELTVCDASYRSFTDAYIKKSGSPEKPYWQIVVDKINKHRSYGSE
jgi:hypothetical protein